MSCVTHTTQSFFDSGWMSGIERGSIVSVAAESQCGQPGYVPSWQVWWHAHCGY